MLLLAALQVRVVEATDVLLTRKRGLHQRGVALATLELGGATFSIGSIHLDLESGERRRHVDEIVARTSNSGSPVILAGDINEEPDGPAWRALASTYPDAFVLAPTGGENTYSATEPVKRIDGIFVDAAIKVLSCGVPDVPGIERASDHRPLLAVVELP